MCQIVRRAIHLRKPPTENAAKNRRLLSLLFCSLGGCWHVGASSSSGRMTWKSSGDTRGSEVGAALVPSHWALSRSPLGIATSRLPFRMCSRCATVSHGSNLQATLQHRTGWRYLYWFSKARATFEWKSYLTLADTRKCLLTTDLSLTEISSRMIKRLLVAWCRLVQAFCGRMSVQSGRVRILAMKSFA